MMADFLLRPDLWLQALLSEQQIAQLCRETLPLLSKDGPLVATKGPAYVIGDLHGQFFDLKRQLDKSKFYSTLCTPFRTNQPNSRHTRVKI
jgi:hypothetical protein